MKQTNIYKLYKLTHRTMNNWLNNRSYKISIIQNISYIVSCSQIRTIAMLKHVCDVLKHGQTAVAKSSLYERCTIAILKHVCNVLKHGQTAAAKSSLYERCTIAILKHVYDVLKQGQTAGAKSSLYERCSHIAILKYVCHVLKQGQASLRWMSHSSVVLLLVLASSLS